MILLGLAAKTLIKDEGKEEGRKEEKGERRGSCYPKVSGFKLLIVVGDERLFLSQ